jgi:hypothetical protein
VTTSITSLDKIHLHVIPSTFVLQNRNVTARCPSATMIAAIVSPGHVLPRSCTKHQTSAHSCGTSYHRHGNPREVRVRVIAHSSS